MKAEILIYAYLAVCACMIVFNVACIFVFRRRDKKIDICKVDFTDEVRRQFGQSQLDPSHRKYLCRKLRRVGSLMAFDKTLEELSAQEPEKTRQYIRQLTPVFICLSQAYLKKNRLQAAYFPYIIKKHWIGQGQRADVLIDAMKKLVRELSLYCRQNALQALYAIGSEESVAEALSIVDRYGYYYHPRLITDGLMSFAGDQKRLAEALWTALSGFAEKMQVAVLDYFRFSAEGYGERILRILRTPDCPDEVAYSCIRYFGKYHYEPAYPYLLDLAENTDETRWEYAAIAATALGTYPGGRTEETLVRILHNRNWYVRYNASQSLDRLGLDYTDLIDVFEGDDRYAGEIMRYRFDQKRMKQRGSVTV